MPSATPLGYRADRSCTNGAMKVGWDLVASDSSKRFDWRVGAIEGSARGMGGRARQ